MTHSTLLILGGGLLAAALAALMFSPRSSGEDEHTREMRKLMTALEAQRRVRDAQQAREARRRGSVARTTKPGPQEPERRTDERAQRPAEQEHAVAFKAEQPERVTVVEKA